MQINFNGYRISISWRNASSLQFHPTSARMTISTTAFAASAGINVSNGTSRSALSSRFVCRPAVSSGGTRRSARFTMKEASGGSSGGYWRGEWLCVDCGYSYKPGRRTKFEDLPSTWKCPQCNAPKRRFAKKAGDFVQETAGTSNAPIIVFSVLGLVATIVFGFWAGANL